jgi:uncharacterized protein
MDFLTKAKLVIIQASPLCNIDCKYCYLPNRTSNKRITERTLSLIFERLFDENAIEDGADIVWHAGEPLVLPVAFYERAFQLERAANRNNVKVRHYIQTNGILLNQEWCDLFLKNKVGLGVSLDGPRDVHDSNRVDRAGRGTFDQVMKGISLLRKNGLDFKILSVLTNRSLESSADIVNFFLKEGLRFWAFNVEEAEGENKESSVQGESAILRYRQFIRLLLETSESRAKDIGSIREVRNLVGATLYAPLESNMQSSENQPFEILNFDCDGNFSTFSPELLTIIDPVYGHFRFGNVYSDTLRSMYVNAQFLRVNQDIQEGVKLCQESCDFFSVCGGGAPSNKLSENRSFASTETFHCRIRIKAGVDTALEYFEKQAGLA